MAKRWLLSTHQGRVEVEHLPGNLDEFCSRFNRRRSRSRGLLFACCNWPSATTPCAARS